MQLDVEDGVQIYELCLNHARQQTMNGTYYINMAM